MQLLGFGDGGRADRQQPGESGVLADDHGAGAVTGDVPRTHAPAVHQRRTEVVRGHHERGAAGPFGAQVAGRELQRAEHAVASLPYLDREHVTADEMALEVVLRLPAVRTLVPGVGVQQQVEICRGLPAPAERVLCRPQRHLRRRDVAGDRGTGQLVQLDVFGGVQALLDGPLHADRPGQEDAQAGDGDIWRTHPSDPAFPRLRTGSPPVLKRR
jgi:hypothetical protein